MPDCPHISSKQRTFAPWMPAVDNFPCELFKREEEFIFMTINIFSHVNKYLLSWKEFERGALLVVKKRKRASVVMAEIQ